MEPLTISENAAILEGVAVGDPISWTPTAFRAGDLSLTDRVLGAAGRVDGRVVYVNAEHRYFRAAAAFPGGVIRECFKF